MTDNDDNNDYQYERDQCFHKDNKFSNQMEEFLVKYSQNYESFQHLEKNLSYKKESGIGKKFKVLLGGYS